jgi:hypothetical protein
VQAAPMQPHACRRCVHPGKSPSARP